MDQKSDEFEKTSSVTQSDPEATARREFLKKIGKAGATAPAVALLMAANFTAAQAQSQYGGGATSCGTGCGSS